VSGNLHNANNALKFLEGKGIDTSAGRMFLASDVEAAMDMAFDSKLEAATAPKPKTMAQAKRMVRQDDELMAQMKGGRSSEIAGAAISAGPDPLSRA
jgi:hypothetical protein